jgi:hypothetical protein
VIRRTSASALFGLFLVAALCSARRVDAAPPADGILAPLTPVSAFARPASWLDPSRLSLSTEVSIGTGWSASVPPLQVTRLSYQLGTPLWMRVSVGSQLGPRAAGSNTLFLEGLDVSYRPFRSLEFQVHYRDLRSPLQLSPYSPYGAWR